MEEVLMSVMYEVPSHSDVGTVVITGEVVREHVLPTLVPRDQQLRRTGTQQNLSERRERSA
jgi:ATP-dependent Clp protease ATP-binding subunit ClpX